MSLLGDISSENLALLDENYLAALAEQKIHDLYAKIIALDINENPIDEIEGLVTGGSINLDGDSSVRRTCNLSMISKNININDYYWGIKTKFKLEIGLSNNLTNEYNPALGVYPFVQWFAMGVYVIASFNASTNGAVLTISISGKDKMCMLNGDLGGQLFASIDFGTEEIKTRKFEKINIEKNNSDVLIAKSYYILDNSNTNNPTALTDSRYSFSASTTGSWYFLNNTYIYDVSPYTYTGTHYNRYKAVLAPTDMFEPLSQTYEANKFYYIENGYYKLNTTSSAKSNNNNYQLKDLYQLTEEYTIKKMPLIKIIREAIHAYAGEPYHNIIINDVDRYGLEQLQWRGDQPLIMIIDQDNNWQNSLLFENFKVYKNSGSNRIIDIEYAQLNALFSNNSGTKLIKFNNRWIPAAAGATQYYRAVKIEFGEDAGYRITDLVYNGDLITSIGETLTSMLDKIKSMLGEFEYLYDTDGRFIFQRKRIYVNTSWSHFVNNDDEKYVTYSNDKKKFAFNFEGSRLLTAIQHTPNLANLHNDISVWGKRIGISGAEIPIHARYAIDRKPVFYRNFQGEVYAVSEAYSSQEANTHVYIVDWREIIYQMALDYFAGQGCTVENPLYIYNLDTSSYDVMSSPDDFLIEVAARNPEYYPNGYTGYEQYYTDMQGFWRQLYDPKYEPIAMYEKGKYIDNFVPVEGGFYRKEKEWSQEEMPSYQCEYYISNSLLTDENVIKMIVSNDDSRLYWHHNVFDAPETLNFWIEFLDAGEELSQFQVSQVGIRSKVINEDKASAIIFKDIPEFIFFDPDDKNIATSDGTNVNPHIRNEMTGYKWLQMQKGLGQFFTISYRNLSIKNKIDELLFKHGYCIENISLTAIPIFSLAPNTRIYVCDRDMGIEGEYIINKIGFSLNYNGTMNISAVKAPERLY